MITKKQLTKGLVAFITGEVLSALDGWQLWAASIAVNLAEANSDKVIEQYLGHPALSSLGVVCDDGLIDIEKVYQAFVQTKKGMKSNQCQWVVDLSAFGLGKFTFKPDDVEALYQYLQGQAAE